MRVKERFGLYSPVTATRHMGHPVEMEWTVLSKKAKFMDLHAAFLQLCRLSSDNIIHFSLYLNILHGLVPFDSPLVLLRNCSNGEKSPTFGWRMTHTCM